MTLGDALQHAEQHAPHLVPFLRELEVRREGDRLLRRVVVLEKRRREFVKVLPANAPLVVELVAQVEVLRGKMQDLNEVLRELLSHESSRPDK